MAVKSFITLATDGAIFANWATFRIFGKNEVAQRNCDVLGLLFSLNFFTFLPK
jgi:hypothetical protein